MTESLGLGMGEAYERLELLRLTVEGMPAALDDRLAKLTAQAQQAVQAARGAENAADRVARTAGVVDGTGRRHAAWLAGGIALGLVVMAGGAWWLGNDQAYGRGYVLGREAGLQENRDTEAAASWANTPAGKLAWRMESTAPGTLAALAKCDRPGWKIEVRDKHRMCWPYAASDRSQYGWEVP